MKKIVYLLSALALGACSGAGGEQEPLPSVRLDTVGRSAAPLVSEFPGRVRAAEEVNLAFKVGGRLQRILVAEGARVRRGDLLAELDPSDYALQLRAVEAEYLRVKAEAERIMALYADSVVTADSYDKARYGLEQMTAKYENARTQLADTRITAPFDGVLQRRIVDPATVVAAGMPVLTLLSTSAPEIEIHIPAADYMRRGEFVAFEASFDVLPDRPLPLRPVTANPKANANQLYALRLALPADADPMPAPGMNALVRITRRRGAEAVIEIPASALFACEGRSCVWVCRADSTVCRREVQVERLTTDGSAQLSSGLCAGERIVTAGVDRLHENQRVAPLAAPARTNIGALL